jgi:V-type H+-transporting ATPase subunit C
MLNLSRRCMGTNGENQSTPKQSQKIRSSLDQTYSYLGGNALGRDKKGRAVKDDAEIQQHTSGEEYSPYVVYEFQID